MAKGANRGRSGTRRGTNWCAAALTISRLSPPHPCEACQPRFHGTETGLCLHQTTNDLARKSHWVWSCGRWNQPKSALRPGASCSRFRDRVATDQRCCPQLGARSHPLGFFSAFAISASGYRMNGESVFRYVRRRRPAASQGHPARNATWVKLVSKFYQHRQTPKNFRLPRMPRGAENRSG